MFSEVELVLMVEFVESVGSTPVKSAAPLLNPGDAGPAAQNSTEKIWVHILNINYFILDSIDPALQLASSFRILFGIARADVLII